MAATPSFVVKIGGSEVGKGSLMDVLIDQSMDLPAMVVCTFHDQSAALAGNAAISPGAEMEISVDTGGPVVLAKVEVISLELDHVYGKTSTVVRGFDRLHRLQHGTKTTVFISMKPTDIVSKVVKAAGLSVGTVDSISVTHPHYHQHNMTDYDLLVRLGHETGCHFWMADGKVNFTAKPTLPAPIKTFKLEDFERISAAINAAGSASDVVVRGWDPKAKKEVMATAKPAWVDATSKASDKASALAGKFGESKATIARLPVSTQAEAEAALKGIQQAVGAGAIELHGTVDGDAKFKPGAVIEIKAEPPSRWDGKYLLSGVRHRWSSDHAWKTEFDVAAATEQTIYGLGGGNGGATNGAAAGHVGGVVTGIVTDLSTEKSAMVKVKFPWLDDKYATDWARVAQTATGANRGLISLPSIDDEVLVGFEHGDARKPIILGGLHNGKDKPPKGFGADATEVGGSKWKTQGLYGNDTALVINDDKKSLALGNNDHKMTFDVAGTKIEIKSSGDVSITATGKVAIKSTGDMTLESQGKLGLKGTAGVTIEGAKVDVKADAGATLGGATVDVKASGPATVKGAIVNIG